MKKNIYIYIPVAHEKGGGDREDEEVHPWWQTMSDHGSHRGSMGFSFLLFLGNFVKFGPCLNIYIFANDVVLAKKWRKKTKKEKLLAALTGLVFEIDAVSCPRPETAK